MSSSIVANLFRDDVIDGSMTHSVFRNENVLPVLLLCIHVTMFDAYVG